MIWAITVSFNQDKALLGLGFLYPSKAKTEDFLFSSIQIEIRFPYLSSANICTWEYKKGVKSNVNDIEDFNGYTPFLISDLDPLLVLVLSRSLSNTFSFTYCTTIF